MKMKWFDRVFLILAALILIALSIFAAGVQLGLFRGLYDDLFATINNGLTVNTIIVCAVCAVIFVMAFRLLVASMSSGEKRETAPDSVLIKTTNEGTIRLAVSAVDSMVQRSARTVQSVRDVSSRIFVTENDNLAVQLNVSFVVDTVVSEATVQVQEAVKSYLEQHTGISVGEVKVFVDAIGTKQTA